MITFHPSRLDKCGNNFFGDEMYIIGLNAYHGDSSACLVKDGQLVAAVEE